VIERAIAAHVGSIDHHRMAPLNDDDRAALTVALIKIVGSDRSEQQEPDSHPSTW
jgi:hypothetical protein